MANNNTYNAACVALIIAAIFGILSFFSAWFVINVSGYTANVSISGYGMIDNIIRDLFKGNAYIPLYIMILSAITLLIAFLPKLGVNIPAPRYSVMLIIIGLAILILAIVWGYGYYSYTDASLVGSVSGFSHAGFGFWYAIISGLLTVFIGALPALTKKV